MPLQISFPESLPVSARRDDIMAAMAEHFSVRTAWHGPGDVSPIGHAANVTPAQQLKTQ